jgi:hypothetical protein
MSQGAGAGAGMTMMTSGVARRVKHEPPAPRASAPRGVLVARTAPALRAGARSAARA